MPSTSFGPKWSPSLRYGWRGSSAFIVFIIDGKLARRSMCPILPMGKASRRWANGRRPIHRHGSHTTVERYHPMVTVPGTPGRLRPGKWTPRHVVVNGAGGLLLIGVAGCLGLYSI